MIETETEFDLSEHPKADMVPTNLNALFLQPSS